METMIRNKVQLLGNLGRDPELKEFESGKRCSQMSVATSERFTFGDGQTKDDVQWHRVVAWGRTAEQAMEQLRKGSRVSLEGRLVHRSYETKEGGKRYITEVVMDRFQVVEPRTAEATNA